MTVEYPGFENLQGCEFNGIHVERLASRSPVRWYVRCGQCGSHWTEEHGRVRYIGCRNQHCGQTPLDTRRSTTTVTSVVVPATRSRDGAARRAELEQEEHRTVTFGGEPSTEGMRAADPAALRHYLDYLEGR